MHTSNLVIVKPEPDEPIAAAVERVMESGRDQWWDWFQIGGRWTGTFDGYKPDEDPANIETCDLCGGTGDRATYRHEPKDGQHETGCNGCLGKGTKTKWPTEWARHDGDVMPLASLTTEHYKQMHRVVAEGYDAFESERYVPWDRKQPFHKMALPPLEWLQTEFADSVVVIVDSHN